MGTAIQVIFISETHEYTMITIGSESIAAPITGFILLVILESIIIWKCKAIFTLLLLAAGSAVFSGASIPGRVITTAAQMALSTQQFIVIVIMAATT